MRLIDATELERQWENCKAKDLYNGGGYLYSPSDVLDTIEEAETIEAEPITHSYWIIDVDYLICDNCECEIDRLNSLGAKNAKNYCPNCGAKMDGE